MTREQIVAELTGKDCNPFQLTRCCAWIVRLTDDELNGLAYLVEKYAYRYGKGAFSQRVRRAVFEFGLVPSADDLCDWVRECWAIPDSEASSFEIKRELEEERRAERRAEQEWLAERALAREREIQAGHERRRSAMEHALARARIHDQRVVDASVRERAAIFAKEHRRAIALRRRLRADSPALVGEESMRVEEVIGRDTDHLLSLDPMNFYIMCGMERGYASDELR